MLDCLIIGAGPAGLSAALYLSRYRRHYKIIDNQDSRASLISSTHNYLGFKEGISGPQLLMNYQDHLSLYDQDITIDTVLSLELDAIKHPHQAKSFIIKTATDTFHAKKVILATGVIDIEPKLPNLETAIKDKLVRHCAICDGYEAIDKKIAIIGSAKKGINEALFLSTYSSKLSFLTLGDSLVLTKEMQEKIEKYNIEIIMDPILNVQIQNKVIEAFETENNVIHKFDMIYSVLGTIVRSDLATKLGAKHINSCLKTNRHKETSITGLYAIGDITIGTDQICHAISQGAIAATNIHNTLAEND